ncbi:MAG: cupredoxin domain-containing protein [Acidimicrobiia bacterium]|nr:cupredoxin domain-containing protein [Acidimicrobiia bacterium]
MVLATTLAFACSPAAPEDRPGPDLLEEAEFEVAATITVDANGFDRDRITVEAGEAVALANGGDGPHRFDGGESFDTGELLPGEQTVVRLDEPGDYEFVDHRTGATGTLTVTGGEDGDP